MKFTYEFTDPAGEYVERVVEYKTEPTMDDVIAFIAPTNLKYYGKESDAYNEGATDALVNLLSDYEFVLEGLIEALEDDPAFCMFMKDRYEDSAKRKIGW